MNQFVPLPNLNGTEYQSVPTASEYDDQFTGRIDHKISDHQQFSAYYYFDDQFYTQPFSFFQAAGANVPGFGGLYNSRYQQLNLTHTWVVNPTAVNEFRFAAFREAQGEFTILSTRTWSRTPVSPSRRTNVFQIPTIPRSGSRLIWGWARRCAFHFRFRWVHDREQL